MTQRVVLFSVDESAADAVLETLASHGTHASLRHFDAVSSVLTVYTDLAPMALERLLSGHPSAEALFDADDARQRSAASSQVDYEWDDEPEPCPHCIGWRSEHVPDRRGQLVLREWHEPQCPTVVAWQ